MRKLFGFFIQGLIATVPIAVTFYLIYLSFNYIDSLLPFKIPGLGLLVIIISITIIGFFVNLAIKTPLYHISKKILDRLPIFKIIVTSIKDLLSAFVGKEKKFEHPVRVTIDRINGIERLGFLTQDSLSYLGIEDSKIAVYFPSSYGILGELYIVPAENVKPLNRKAAEVMKFIISGGVSKSSPLFANDENENTDEPNIK